MNLYDVGFMTITKITSATITNCKIIVTCGQIGLSECICSLILVCWNKTISLYCFKRAVSILTPIAWSVSNSQRLFFVIVKTHFRLSTFCECRISSVGMFKLETHPVDVIACNFVCCFETDSDSLDFISITIKSAVVNTTLVSGIIPEVSNSVFTICISKEFHARNTSTESFIVTDYPAYDVTQIIFFFEHKTN